MGTEYPPACEEFPLACDCSCADGVAHCSVTVTLPQTTPTFIGTANGDLKNHVLQTARRDPGAVQRAAQRRREHGEVSVPPQVLFLSILKTSFTKSRIIGGIKWYNALHHQKFQDAVQQHQRVSYEQVEIAAALVTSQKAAQILPAPETLKKY